MVHGFYALFNSISVISRQWKDDYERLSAMKHHLLSYITTDFPFETNGGFIILRVPKLKQSLG